MLKSNKISLNYLNILNNIKQKNCNKKKYYYIQ